MLPQDLHSLAPVTKVCIGKVAQIGIQSSDGVAAGSGVALRRKSLMAVTHWRLLMSKSRL